jgi:hypothetical protein
MLVDNVLNDAVTTTEAIASNTKMGWAGLGRQAVANSFKAIFVLVTDYT